MFQFQQRRVLFAVHLICFMTMLIVHMDAARAEIKTSRSATETASAERPAAPPVSWELVCYQLGREIIHEKGLKSVASPGGPGALITYVNANGVPAYVIVGGESTCISRPDVSRR
jgi:hypothetical protein